MLLGGLRIILIMLWVFAWCAVAWPITKLQPQKARGRVLAMMQRCFRGLLRIAGVKLVCSGALSDARPLLLISNHVSYLDIPVLGAAAPVRFTPKADIEGWPIIGRCAKLLQCVFIDRKATRTLDNQTRLQQALAEHSLVSMFPEGTTGNGRHLMPFRSSYFALAEEKYGGEALWIQPVAIKYVRLNDLPMDSSQVAHVAWYGDMRLLPHALRLLSFGSIGVRLAFGVPVNATDFPNRKALAAHCEQQVRNLLQTLA